MDIREIVTELQNERDRVINALTILNSNGHKPGNLRGHYKPRISKRKVALLTACPECNKKIPTNAMHKHLMGKEHGWTGGHYRKWFRRHRAGLKQAQHSKSINEKKEAAATA